MSVPEPCQACWTTYAERLNDQFDGFRQRCPRCGEFKITGTAVAMLRAVSPDAQRNRKLSAWVREQNQAGVVPTLTSEAVKSISERAIPTVSERGVALLVEAARGLESLDATFNVNDLRFVAATCSVDQRDVTYLVQMLSLQGWLATRALDGSCEILPDGHMKLDELRAHRTQTAQGFVAMWFSPDLQPIYEHGFEPGIFAAGYDPLRVDRVEHVNRIDDEIIRQINASRFLVADFTGHRGGVYFEAGYALGKGIPVFWTCRQADVKDLHFDIRQFNCIDWTDKSDLAHRLAARLEAVLGPGPKKKQ